MQVYLKQSLGQQQQKEYRKVLKVIELLMAKSQELNPG